MRVFLIRHAESYSNTGGRVMSFTDLPLTEKGVQQAVRAGEALRGRLRADAPLCAFCSPLRIHADACICNMICEIED